MLFFDSIFFFTDVNGVTDTELTPGGVAFVVLTTKGTSTDSSAPRGRDDVHLNPEDVREVLHFHPRALVVTVTPRGVFTKTPKLRAFSKPLL